MATSPEAEQSNAASDQWIARILNIEASNAGDLPAWWRDAYHSYRKTLEQPDYPCFFGQAAERRGEMFYAFEGERPETARATMQRFVELGHDPKLRRHSLAMFCTPDPALTSHAEFLRRFWTLLQQLQEADNVPMQPADPDDPLWEFSFGGRKMFVVGTAPTYRQRRSRVVGSGIVLLFQPRELFTDLATGKPIAADIRRQIHARMLEYDAMPVHPDIGFYGDPHNREWKQYCLPDDNTPVTGRCPFGGR
ncbi:YqcI/YcgG family protein [Caballeronia sp. DA-9]|uniref:YqcI/YcgG family protein n=1 Tax=Caballeronia sp. DA-9 TaxID=3436237 RepID=UPI003F66C957